MIRPAVTVPRWRVAEDDAGGRLDKFLASPNRLGSRSRVVTALDRGRVFVNDVEAAAADGSSRVNAGDDIDT
jgi:ribosomal 50S subunit-recycling heat shock protein